MKREPSFNLVLADPNEGLCREWEKFFEPYPNVGIHHGRFEDVDFDCVVSPANSFGLMDGGVDEAITMYFGQQMMDRVQEQVIKQWGGEQPVGTSMIVRGTSLENTNLSDLQYVAHTPTMILPYDISRTTNVYMAFKAMLLEVEKFNEDKPEWSDGKIFTVVCPGMGTGAGRVPYRKAASMMARAYENVYNPPDKISWGYATMRYKSIVESHNV